MNNVDPVKLARDLIQSKFICKVTDHAAYNWLSKPENFNQMNQNLKPFGAKLVSFGDKTVFAALNEQLSEEDKKKVIKQFDEIHHNIRPIIDILTALAVADDGLMLSSGYVIKQAALVMSANNNRDFEHRLKIAAEHTKSQHKPNDEKIESLLQKLQKDGLLRLTEPDKKIYQVTGKIDYVMQIIEVIDANYLPQLPDEEVAEQQGLGL